MGPEERDREAEDRDEAADARDLGAEARNQKSAARDVAAWIRDETAIVRDRAMRDRLHAASQRNHAGARMTVHGLEHAWQPSASWCPTTSPIWTPMVHLWALPLSLRMLAKRELSMTGRSYRAVLEACTG